MFDNDRIGVRYSRNDAAILLHTCCNRGRSRGGGLDQLAKQRDQKRRGRPAQKKKKKGHAVECSNELLTLPVA